MIAFTLLMLGSMVSAVAWHDDFFDYVADLIDYQVIKTDTGVVTLTESETTALGGYLGYLDMAANNPGGSYVLTAVKVELGDTVRTKFYQRDAWDNYSISAIGLAYSLSADRLLDVSSAAFFLQQQRDNVIAYRHVGAAEQSVVLNGVGDPFQQTWIYELVVGQDKGGGTFDVVFSVYDLNGTQIGQSTTLTTSTPTGDLYWYIGDSRTQDYIYQLDIGPDLPPPGPLRCSEVVALGQTLQTDLNGDCRVCVELRPRGPALCDRRLHHNGCDHGGHENPEDPRTG